MSSGIDPLASIAHGVVVHLCDVLYSTSSSRETFVKKQRSYACLLSDGITEEERVILFASLQVLFSGIAEIFF